MGFVEQLVGLLHKPLKSSHDHVIRLLTDFVSDYPQAVRECRRPDFNLEELLKTKITSMTQEDADRYEVNLSNMRCIA